MRKTKDEMEKITSEIILEAIKIFGNKGYQATNLQDIADSLGMTRTPMYYHYKNKLVLYEQAIDYYLEQKQKVFSRIFETDEDIFVKIKNDLILCTRRGLTELTLFMGVDDLPELASVKDKRRQAYEFIYGLKMTAVTEAIEKAELRSDTDKTEFINHLYILFYGVIGMTQSPYHNLTQDDNLKLIDTILQGMILKYSTKLLYR